MGFRQPTAQQADRETSDRRADILPGQWQWVAACALSLALAGVLVWQWERKVVWRTKLEAATAAVRAQTQRNAQLSADLGAFDDLLDWSTGQKEQLVNEIAEFQNQLEVLSRRTRNLELVKDQLESLGSEFATFRKSEDRFQADLRTLETSVSAAGKQEQR